MSSEPRLSPISDDDWPPEIADMLDGFAGKLNVYRTMAHHPELLRSWAPLRDHIVNRSALGEVNLEIVILRTGHHLKSDYEWSHHIERARMAGLTDTRIRSIGGALTEMEETDAMLCKAVDELFATSRISARTLTTLDGAFGTPVILDLMATVGFYSTLGFILNTFETPLDADIRASLDTNPLEP